MAIAARQIARRWRQARVRRRVRGADELPRLCVYRSNRHIYAQVISDQSGRTLTAASTLKFADEATGNRTAARRVGEDIARLCQERNIDRVVFDRNGFLYHGRVKELAEGARSVGLKF